MTRLLKEGEKVKIDRIDPYGYNGRDPHPPTGSYVSSPFDTKPVPFVPGPLDGTKATVVSYEGWDAEPYDKDITNGAFFGDAPVYPDSCHWVTHFYLCECADGGRYVIADVEMS